jgi:hypothetical protein
MKYLVNFEIKAQGFSEIVEAEDKSEALDKASKYLRNRMPFLESNKIITPIHSNMELKTYSTNQKRTDKI